MRWFDRKFQFSHPPEIHASVVERLRGLLPRIDAKRVAYSDVDWTARIDDTWSMQENVGHLFDLESLWFERLKQFDASVDVLAPADLENTRTHEADHNTASLDDILDALTAARSSLVERLDAMDASHFARESRHPRLDQPMRQIDHVLFVAEHDDHHLARIEAIGCALSASR